MPVFADAFQDATPIPTDLPTDNLLRAAVRLCGAISAREAQLAQNVPESPLSPLTASSSGSPQASHAPLAALDELSAALDALLEEATNLRTAPDFTDSACSSDGDATPESVGPSSASSYSDGAADGADAGGVDADSVGADGVDPDADGSATGKRKRKRKRKSRPRRRKSSAHNNGQDDVRNGKKEYQRKKRRKKRQQDRVDAANSPPYARKHGKRFYKHHHGVRLLNLKTFEVKYATGPGAYVGKKKFGKKVYSVDELKAMGFVELEWNGEDTILILDRDNRIVCALIGPPQNLTPRERAEWEAGMADLARAFEEERQLHERSFKKNLRGDFDAFAAGFTMGPGASKPANLTESMSAGLRATAERLLAHGQLRRLAGFASEVVAHYFPLAFAHLRDRLAAMCAKDPSLRFPFGGISLYPACTFNLGPHSVCFGHTDGSNYPGLPCTVSPFGPYNPALGGHFILFDFKLYFRFPSGSTVALSSAGFRHGNTRLAPNDKRYSFTQYCSGGLIRYIAYGFRLVGPIPDAERERVDAEMGEGWRAQLARFSTWGSLLVDRKQLYDRERL